MAGVADDEPVELGDDWIVLSPRAPVDRRQEPSGGRSDRQLELVRELVGNAERLEEGRWLLGLYRFHVEFATPAGETCHVAIDHGRVEIRPGPAPGERLMTVRAECDLDSLEELVTAGVGPVDA